MAALMNQIGKTYFLMLPSPMMIQTKRLIAKQLWQN